MMITVSSDNLDRYIDMSPDEIEAEFEHGFVTVAGDEGTLEAIDVADYIVSQAPGRVDRMGLQKVLYFCQSLSLALAGQPIFGDAMEAWRYGPVVPDVYRRTKEPDTVRVHAVPGGDGSLLNDAERSVVNLVLSLTKDRQALELMKITHSQGPWQRARARAGAGPQDNCNEVVRLEDIREMFVRSLDESAHTIQDDADEVWEPPF